MRETYGPIKHTENCYHNQCTSEEQQAHGCAGESDCVDLRCHDCGSWRYMVEARAKRGQAIEVTEKQFWYMLEVLPPIYGPGCYGISEAYHFDPDGKETRIWFRSERGKYYCFFGTRDDAKRLFQRQPQKIVA